MLQVQQKCVSQLNLSNLFIYFGFGLCGKDYCFTKSNLKSKKPIGHK